MNEFDFIDSLRLRANSRKHSARVLTGIGDDASIIAQSADRDLIVTTDLLVEGVDFHRGATPARLLGHKALAVSLSDIAAMGARPFWSFLSIGMPRAEWTTNFKDDFFEGYFALADRFGVTLSGGDVSETKEGIVIDSIVLGEVKSGAAVKRSGASAGDQIYVTGNLGGAAAGLKLIENGARVDLRSEVRDHESVPPAVAGGSVSEPGAVATGSTDTTRSPADDHSIQSLLLRQLRPSSRVGWGIVLGEEGLATAMIDISDGLSSDLNHLCTESNSGALIESSSIPLDDDVQRLCGRRALDALALALHGGEDLELLFTVTPENVSRLPKRVDGVSISHIGEVTADAGVINIAEKNRIWKLEPQGFEHFKNEG
ncbi:MAG TPA: thiamine-monophosphate kinase [Pyrinomonadaceae bacterium]